MHCAILRAKGNWSSHWHQSQMNTRMLFHENILILFILLVLLKKEKVNKNPGCIATILHRMKTPGSMLCLSVKWRLSWAEHVRPNTWFWLWHGNREVEPFARLKMKKTGKWVGSKVIVGANYNSRLATWGKRKAAKQKERVQSTARNSGRTGEPIPVNWNRPVRKPSDERFAKVAAGLQILPHSAWGTERPAQERPYH